MAWLSGYAHAKTGSFLLRRRFLRPVSSTGRRLSWRSLPTFGWLGTTRSYEGIYGHGKAPGKAPARENGKTGRGHLDWQRFAPGTISATSFRLWGGVFLGDLRDPLDAWALQDLLKVPMATEKPQGRRQPGKTRKREFSGCRSS